MGYWRRKIELEVDKMNEKILKIGLILSLFLAITGCQSYNELNDVMIVDGIGIDKIDDDYQISFNSYKGNDEYELHIIQSPNLNDIFNDIYLDIDKKIYLSHLNVLVLSSDLEDEDIEKIINVFNRRSELRGSFNVVMVHDYEPKLFSNTSSKITKIIQNNYRELGNVYPTTFNDLITDYANMSLSYLPILNSDDMTIMGMHSLFSEYDFYENAESLLLNIVFNKIKAFTIVIDDDEVAINDLKIDYDINDNDITLNIHMNYRSTIAEETIERYFSQNIRSILEREVGKRYFVNLIKKNDYDYYRNHSDIKMTFHTNIYLTREEMTNMKEDDLFD